MNETMNYHNNREVIKRVEYPAFLTMALVNQWAELVKDTELIRTPVREVDLSEEGLGYVFVKDESTHPTGTFKYRFAAHLARSIYGEFARNLKKKLQTGDLQESDIETIPILRVSAITAGNEGVAIAKYFEDHLLPPPSFLADKNISPEERKKLQKLRANVFLIDLSATQFSPDDILALTENKGGIDATSIRVREPEEMVYGGLAAEIFDEKPNAVYVPCGSEKQFEDLIALQVKTYQTTHNNSTNAVSIFAANPAKKDSIADKLPSDFRPFALYDWTEKRDGQSLVLWRFREDGITGKDTGIYKVAEKYIKRAYETLIAHGFNAEPSAAAGLALYMQRVEEARAKGETGNVDIVLGNRKTNKVLIVNTGNGNGKLPHIA